MSADAPVHHRHTAGFSSLAALLLDVMTEARVKPKRTALAVAGPVSGDDIHLTNLPWRFSATQLAVDLGVARIIVENDVAAVAWALTVLGPDHALSLTPRLPMPSGPRVVVAPGTGLGVAALAPAPGNTWIAVASEGGHAGFAIPQGLTDEDRAALSRERSSWEDLISGVGLARLYRTLGGDAAVDTPEAVTGRARQGEQLAAHCMDVFCHLLGAFAGDTVLMFAARGGCVIGGGLVKSIGPLFNPGIFLAGFRDKDRFTDYMAQVPVHLLTHPNPALVGLGVLLDQRR